MTSHHYTRLKLFASVTGAALFLIIPAIFLKDHVPGNFFAVFASPGYWLFCLSFIFLYYLNSFLLVPSLLLNKRYIEYGLITAALLCIYYFLRPFDNMLREAIGGPPKGPLPLGHPPEKPFDIGTIAMFIMMITFGTASRLLHQLATNEQKIIAVEAERAKAELHFLKAQINPHFIFNTLNGLYTLAITENKGTAESILRLANLLRYFTDEPQKDLVPLEQEAACIADYVALQKIRFGDETNVLFNFSNPHGKTIAPLLLINFVENCFTHGMSKRYPYDINISLVGLPDRIEFICKNTMHQTKGSKNFGFGIPNVKKRLEHQYAGAYKLDIEAKNGVHTVKLLIYA